MLSHEDPLIEVRVDYRGVDRIVRTDEAEDWNTGSTRLGCGFAKSGRGNDVDDDSIDPGGDACCDRVFILTAVVLGGEIGKEDVERGQVCAKPGSIGSEPRTILLRFQT